MSSIALSVPVVGSGSRAGRVLAANRRADGVRGALAALLIRLDLVGAPAHAPHDFLDHAGLARFALLVAIGVAHGHADHEHDDELYHLQFLRIEPLPDRQAEDAGRICGSGRAGTKGRPSGKGAGSTWTRFRVRCAASHASN